MGDEDDLSRFGRDASYMASVRDNWERMYEALVAIQSRLGGTCKTCSAIASEALAHAKPGKR